MPATGSSSDPEAAEPAAADVAPDTLKQVLSRVLGPRGLVVLSRERIQATLDEAAERGRVTRTDANDLVAELVKRGAQQTDELLDELEELVGRGRGQLEMAGRRARRSPPVETLVRGAERARLTVAGSSELPIVGYGELTVAEVARRLPGLTPAELRRVREHERRHANRKSVLAAVEKLLG